MASKDRGVKPNIYPLGHPLRAPGGVVQNKPTPQPSRRPAPVAVTPTPPAAPVEEKAPTAPTGEEDTTLNTDAGSTANTTATTTEV